MSSEIDTFDSIDAVTLTLDNVGYAGLGPEHFKFTNASTDWIFTVDHHGNVAFVNEDGSLTGLEGVVVHGTLPPNFEVFVGNGSVLEFTDQTLFVANSDNANIARLYEAALGRAPDVQGLAGWEAIFQNNVSATARAEGVYQSLAQPTIGNGMSIATGFVQSAEFQNKYGSLDDAGFVTQLYHNVLDRDPSAAERDAWVANIHNGESHEMVLVGFAESAENIAKVAHAGWLIQV